MNPSSAELSGAPALSVEDVWVPHPEGRLFARSWAPADPQRISMAAPLVLLHDSLGCVDLWRDLPVRIAQATGRRVIAYDRLGFGRSDARREQPSLDFVAEEASRYFPVLCDHLGLERFALLGHSVGGGMAIECAAAFPTRCEALVTIAAQVFAEERTLQGIRAAKVQFEDPAQVQRLARYHGARAQWVLHAWTDSWLHPGFAGWNVLEALGRLRAPMLAIHGELDEYGSVRHPALIGERAGGTARIEVLPDTGHVPHRERTDLVLELVAGFLRGEPASGGGLRPG
jgi:pimeloyl-ACP methyl ester carboxylesterase